MSMGGDKADLLSLAPSLPRSRFEDFAYHFVPYGILMI
jgi:hypothetical protein